MGVEVKPEGGLLIELGKLIEAKHQRTQNPWDLNTKDIANLQCRQILAKETSKKSLVTSGLV